MANYNGTSDNDSLTGSSTADSLTGLAGNDSLKGGGGNDTIVGGDGVDTAQYTGTQSGYKVQAQANGAIAVTDTILANGDEGADILQSTESIAFADVTLAVTSFERVETRLNAYTNADQLNPSLVPLSGGGFIAVWTSNGQDGSGWGVYGQCLDAGLNPVGSEFRLNTRTENDQYFTDESSHHAVAATSDGGFVATWRSWSGDQNAWAVIAQRFGADGRKIGSETVVNTYVQDEQRDPAVAVLAQGQYVITWMSLGQDGSGWGVYGQLFDSAGVKQGAEFRVNTTVSESQYAPSVSSLANGGFVVSWRDNSDSHAKAQIFNAEGAKVGSELTLSSNTSMYPATAAIAGGGFWAAWQSAGQDGSSWGIYAQKFSDQGVKLGAEIKVNTTVFDSQEQPQISVRADGSFVVAWASYGQDGSGMGVYAQSFTAAGAPVGSEMQINTVATGDQSRPDVVALDDGRFIVAWQSSGQDGSGNGVYARVWDPVEGFNSLKVTGGNGNDLVTQSSASIIDGGAGADTLQGGAGPTTYVIDNAQDAVLEAVSGGRDEVQSAVSYTIPVNVEVLTLTGTAAVQATGSAGSDTLTGNAAANILIGLGGDDTLSGLTGDDTFDAGAGNDVIDGGAGVNTVVIEGTADFFSRKVNANGDWIVTDMLTDGSDPIDGSNQGVDTLRNIQVIKFVKPDGTIDLIQTLDDFSNIPDPSNVTVAYGAAISGRINYYTDTDHFQLPTTAGDKVMFTGYYANGGVRLSSDTGINRNVDDRGILNFSSTGVFDLNVSGAWGNPSSTSPTSAASYTMIMRRMAADGTVGPDRLEAGTSFEYLNGDAGDDTLVGSARSDLLLGGSGNDLIQGGGGNDEVDGGGGSANVAVFSGKRSDYSFEWKNASDGIQWRNEGGYFLSVNHLNSGGDGVDSLRNIQTLRFSDGDLTLDAESNTPEGAKVVALGEAITGTLSGTSNWGWWNNDTDYFKQKLTGISTSTALRIKIQETFVNANAGELRVEFMASDSQDLLRFAEVGGSNTYTTMGGWGGSTTQTYTYFVKPTGYASGSDFGGEGVDVRISGWSQTQDITGGLNYRVVVDRVQLGTAAADTLIADGKSSYVDAKDGNDSVTGSALSEEIAGGTGDDTIDAGLGDDTITDGAGRNQLKGGLGNDIFDVSTNVTPNTTPTDTIDGGEGVDTLKVAGETNFAGLSLTSVEVLDGSSGRTMLSIDQVKQLGFTAAKNITFSLAASLESGGTIDATTLPGTYSIRGTNQSDLLKGNNANNVIYLGAEEALGSGYGVDSVYAGAGDDQIVLSVSRSVSRPIGPQIFSSYDLSSRTYFQKGLVDGGDGVDTVIVDLSNPWWTHAWGGDALYYSGVTTPVWYLNLSQWDFSGIEKLDVRNPGDLTERPWEVPTEIILSAAQVRSLSSTSGLRAVSILGGGALDLAHLADLSIATWRIGDAMTYTVNGTQNGDSLTLNSGVMNISLGAGDDEFVVDGKALVVDTLDGGAGNDVLTIRGEDVDLSGATLAGIESISVSSKSLSMTEAQWSSWGPMVHRVNGVNTSYILSVSTPGTVTLQDASTFVGLTGSDGNDRLTGNAGDNILVGGAGDDLLLGLGGADRLVTGDGVDSLYGGDGNDTLSVTQKTTVRDLLSGGAGTDTLWVQDGQDLSLATLSDLEILRGSGTVTVSPAQIAGLQTINGVAVLLTGTSSTFSLGNLSLVNGAKLLLPQFDPQLSSTSTGVLGSRGDDVISGGPDGDLISGGRGADYIDGGQGPDTLIGGSGADTLVGGGGDDVFRVDTAEFDAASASGGYVYADRVDGSSGNDLLEVNFSGTSNNRYIVSQGTFANVEALKVNSAGWDQFVEMPAAVLRQFSSLEFNASNAEYRYSWPKLTIQGDGQDIHFNSVTDASKLERLILQGEFFDIDATHINIGPVANYLEQWYNYIQVSSFHSITLAASDNRLRVSGDNVFTADLGAGNDLISVDSVRDLRATIVGGLGTDTLNLSNNGLIDISYASLTSIENIQHGTATVVVSQSQLDSLSFDGSGAKFLRSGDMIIGSASADNFNGDGTGSFQGGKGNDAISNVDTAVFTGNYADYSVVRSGNTLTIKQERGSLADGTDTVTGALNLQFADTTLAIDDAPNDYWQYRTEPAYSQLTAVDYGKRMSIKKDYASDTDVYAATLVPNSPLFVDASSPNGNWWSMSFIDKLTGQQLQFKSLVYNWTSGDYNRNMSADQKWLPMITVNGVLQPYTGGDVVMQVNVNTDANVANGVTDFAFTLNYLDDYAGNANTLGVMNAQVGQVQGYIGDIGDADWVRTQLIAGTKYEFHLNGLASGGGTLVDPLLTLLDGNGRALEQSSGVFDLATDAVGNDDVLIFRPNASGTYYLAVSDVAQINKGSWTLTQASLDTIPGNLSSVERAEWSAGKTMTVSSEINTLGDHDWFRVWLDKGLTYNFRAQGSSNGGTLADPQLSVRTITGILLRQDDNGGGGADARVVYSAPESGWYFLDAGASGNAGKGTYTVAGSTLKDDYSNDLLTEGLIQAGTAAVPGTPLHGLVSYNGDSDWIRVGLSKGSTYVIDLAGDISDGAQLDPLEDPVLTLRDATGKVIAVYDDFGGSLNSRAYFTPSANGLYYLEARSAFKYDIGAYQLSINTAPADDYAQAFNASTQALTLGAALSGTIGIPGDRDAFKVTLQAGSVYQLNVQGLSGHQGTLADPYLRVLDAQGRIVDFDNNSGDGNDAQLYLAPTQSGTYYVEASSNNDRGMGTYKVSVQQRDLPPDDAAGDLSTQASISPGQSFAGNLLTHGDQDWFGIRLVANQDYVVLLNGAHSGGGTLNAPVLEIHAANGTLLSTVDLQLTTGDPAALFSPTATGNYYLAVKSATPQTDTGTYTLVVRAPDDYSNTKTTANLLSLNQTLDGAIQWSDGAFGARAFDSLGLATDMDEDWFKFDATQSQVLSLSVKIAQGSPLSRPMIEVVDALGRSLAVGDGLETTSGEAVATFKAVAAGTYYARVIDGAGATGGYSITLSPGDASDEDATAPVGLNFVSTGQVAQAQSNARIGLPGDADNFTVALQQGHSYRFETVAVRDGAHAPLTAATMTLDFKQAGSATSESVAVVRDVATPSAFDAMLYEANASGVMTVNVAAVNANETGHYKIRVIDLGAAQVDDRPDAVTGYSVSRDGLMAANESQSGKVDALDDTDLFAINLTAGNVYDFSVKGFADALGTLSQASLKLLDGNGLLVSSGQFDVATGRNDLAVSVFSTGRYYLSVSAANLPGNTGTYVLDTHQRDLSTPLEDDLSADTRSGALAAPGRAATGRINYADDLDWIKTSLQAGKVYVFDVLGDGSGAGGTLKDGTLRLLDASGNELAQDDNSGAGNDAHLQFTVTSTGDYFLEVGGNNAQLGTYTMRVRELYSGVADPLQSAQWYLSALGLDSLHGEITGAGVTVGVVDEGIDTSHPDLQEQLLPALAFDTQFDTADGRPKYPVLVGPPDNHGTAVAGIIAAQANNETGIVGVAPDADLVSTRVKWSWDQITQALTLQSQFDVSNNSWGATVPFADNFNSTLLTFAYQALRTGVEDGRDGLGTVFVFSAGNSASYGENTNYHNFQNAREVITVAATNPDGSVAGFSTPGASVLVGAYGVGLLTTDRHQPGWGYEPGSNYTNFSGTSAAAPVVSGVVALMLEANPYLGYRDVQQVLALSATHPDSMSWKVNAASNFNLGGMQFNDSLGFGLVDAYSAVRLAQTWTQTDTAINEISASARAFGLREAIPDGDSAYTKTFRIDSDLRVEHIELGIDLRHTRLGDLILEVTSPSGTVSRLMDRPTVNAEQPFGLSGEDSGIPTHLLWDFSSVQFWGEEAAGDWTISIKDVRAEQTGTLSSLSLRVYGERDTGDDVYVFTEEGFKTPTNRVLSDESGTDTINAAPMQHDLYVDLPKGLIAAEGVTYTVASWSVLENIITGIGADNVIANDSANLIRTFEGNDSLQGGLGNDTLDGGSGFDTVVYGGAIGEFNVSWNPTLKTVTVVDGKLDNGNEGTDTLKGIERIVFSNGEMNLASKVGNQAPTVTQALFDQPVTVGKGMGIDYAIPETAFVDTEQGNATDLQVTVASASGGELPAWLSYDPETRSFSGVPPQDYQGQLKLLVTAVDDFNQSVSDILTLQFGDNQAPLLDNPSELSLREDAANTSLGLHAPTDPEGKTVTVKILEVPTQGKLLDKLGNTLAVDAVLNADGLSEVHYVPAADTSGDMGYFRYQATDDDGVAAESSVHVFVDPVNDAPRFATNGSKLVVQFPLTQAVTLDVARPTDPEATLGNVTVVDLPAMGVVRLDSIALSLNQVLSFDQLNRLSFTLAENVNGPIGGLTLRATDPEGLSTDWTLSLEVQGNIANSSGTVGADALYGSVGNDTLYGLSGDDTLTGNAGNDRLLAGPGNDALYGGSGNDALDGSSGNDQLDGGSGNDTMSGGPGNDTYIVDSASDVVLEVIAGGAGGKDLVVTSVSLSAPDNVENLQAAAGSAINLTGNDLDNILSGNELVNKLDGKAGRDTLLGGAGNDTLDGGVGVDRLAGGQGDDTYLVNSRSDIIVELANEGVDTVRASASYTLPSNVEHLVLEEGGDYSAGGNSLDNHLFGNSGANVLAGGLGRDTLEGGLGNDTYVLSDSLDTIIDTGGIDTLRSSLDVSRLAADLENIELVGLHDLMAVGNASNNSLVGNSGDNLLEGGAGVDTLTGGDGSDQFVLAYNGTGKSPDAVTDFVTTSDLLVIDLASFGITPAQAGLLSSGSVAATSFVKGTGARALDNNDYFLLDTARGVLMFDPDGSGATAAMDVVQLVGTTAQSVVASDIFVAI